MYRITQLAREFGLSRSTLLYYDQIGLLPPSGRSEAGYRSYSLSDRERLATICSYRQAGLGIEDIRRLLALNEQGGDEVIRQRTRVHGREHPQTLAARRDLPTPWIKPDAIKRGRDRTSDTGSEFKVGALDNRRFVP